MWTFIEKKFKLFNPRSVTIIIVAIIYWSITGFRDYANSLIYAHRLI